MKVSDSAPPLYYQAEDLSIGCKVDFLKHQFLIIDADEYALSYMEKHKEQVSSEGEAFVYCLFLNSVV